MHIHGTRWTFFVRIAVIKDQLDIQPVWTALSITYTEVISYPRSVRSPTRVKCTLNNFIDYSCKAESPGRGWADLALLSCLHTHAIDQTNCLSYLFTAVF